MRHELLWLGSLALALCPAVAQAQANETAIAQSLFDEAKALMAGGRPAEACPKLEESQRLEPRSGTLINLAACYERTARLASAWSEYLEAAAQAKAVGNLEREAVARERAGALFPRLARLKIVVGPALKALPGLEVRRDGVMVREPAWGVALPSDAGPHRVVVSAAGHRSFEAGAAVVEGQTTTVSVPELLDETAPHSGPDSGLGSARLAALLSGGVGVVGIGLGTAFGLASKAKHDEAAKYCVHFDCTDARGVTYGNAARTDGNISTALMIVGGAALAAGLALWLSAPPRATEAPTTQVGLGLGTLQMRGAF